MKRLYAGLLLAVLVCTVQPVLAQTAFESTEGESSALFRGGGIGLINFANESIKLSYNRQVGGERWLTGAELKLSADDGIFNFVDEGESNVSGVTGAASVGYLQSALSAELPQFVSAHWMALRFDVSHHERSLAQTTPQISIGDTAYWGWGVSGFYNAMLEIGGEDVFGGLSVRYGEQNNYDDLDKIEVCEQIAAGTHSLAQKCTGSRTGDFRSEQAATVAADVVWLQRWLRNRVGLQGALRYNAFESELVPGVGILFTESGSPLNVLGAAVLEFREGGVRVGLQMGVPFGP